MFTLAAGVLFGFAAMAADVGMILHQSRELQNTADAAQAPALTPPRPDPYNRYAARGSGRSSVVEHLLPKQRAVGSIPIARSRYRRGVV